MQMSNSAQEAKVTAALQSYSAAIHTERAQNTQ